MDRISQMVLVVKNLPANAGDIRDSGLIPESGGSPGEGNGSPLLYSRLENPMDGGVWRATVHTAADGQTWLSTYPHTVRIWTNHFDPTRILIFNMISWRFCFVFVWVLWGFFLLFLFFFAPLHRILVPVSGIEPGPLAVKVPSLNHWTSRVFPGS